MPRRVGDYEIVGELGRGGMAVVHLGRTADGAFAAIKELSGFHDGDDSAARRFLREAVVGSSLSHPNIVAVIDRMEDGGRPYIVMEWVDGGTLRPFVGELSLAQMGGVFEGLLSALAHAGRMGVVHRDLKPENIMLTTEGGIPKIADFGIAKATNATESSEGRLTRTGTAVGTPGYMAPEQAMSGDISPATDLYAAGCIAFETLTGRLPFAGQAPMVMLMSHANNPVPDIRDIDPLVSAPVAEWVSKMTALDPDDRFEEGEAAWESLEAALVETLGPDWREQSEIKPEPAEYLTVQESGPATGSFATFAAPVALHEALAGELSERATFGGSPAEAGGGSSSPRFTRDQLEQAVRDHSHQTPPSVPVAAASVPLPPPRSNRNRFIAAGVGAVVVIAIIVGVVVGTSGSSSQLPDGLALTGAGLTVHAPAGWTTETLGAVDGIEVAAAAGSAANQGVGLASIPTAKLIGLAAAADPSTVTVGTARAAEVNIGDTRLLLLTRAGGGISTLVCRGGAAESQCAGVAQTALPALAAPPMASDGQTARGALGGEHRTALKAGHALSSARTGDAQVSAAEQLASALTTQEASLAATQGSVSTSATAADTVLQDGLLDLAKAWDGYASAVTAGKHASLAIARVREAQTDLRAAAGAAAALGLALGSDVYGGPNPPAARTFTSHTSAGSSGGSGGSGSSSGTSPGASSSSANSSSGANASSSGSSSSGSSSSATNSSSGGSSTTPAKQSTSAAPTKTQSQQLPGAPSGPSLSGGNGVSTKPTGGGS